MNKKNFVYITAILAILAAGGAGYLKMARTDKTVADLQKQVASLQELSRQQADELATNVDQTAKAAALAQSELDRRQAVSASEDDLLTAAVAKVAPAVVSIVISKNVPQLEVTYVNPFGDDPFFKDFGARIPVYRQKGTVKQKVGAGTGFLVSSNGYIVTNRHVVDDTSASYTVLLADGKQLVATVIYRDPSHDLAIVKINGSGYATASLGDSSSLKLGQRVAAIGNALGEYNNSVSVGIVSGLNRTITAGDSRGGSQETLTDVIQTDAAINPGNSGGPLIDLNGNVVAVNVATVAGSNNISFALPIDSIKSTITSAIKQ
jgi:S1-C subfamily serine protease